MRVIAALVLALAFAPPSASAQLVGREPPGPVLRGDPFLGSGLVPGPAIPDELRQVRGDIAQARESGRITRSEARQLTREARLIGRLTHRYGHDGLSPSERAELDRRTAILRSRVASR